MSTSDVPQPASRGTRANRRQLDPRMSWTRPQDRPSHQGGSERSPHQDHSASWDAGAWPSGRDTGQPQSHRRPGSEPQGQGHWPHSSHIPVFCTHHRHEAAWRNSGVDRISILTSQGGRPRWVAAAGGAARVEGQAEATQRERGRMSGPAGWQSLQGPRGSGQHSCL